MPDELLISIAERLGQHMHKAGHRLALAESCTGGWIAQSVTEIAGSSMWFDRGFVTYSNDAKIAMLGVSPNTLQKHGAVSPQTACEMVAGALQHSDADLALAVTGIAGPGGGTADKSVGLVFIAWQLRGRPCHCQEQHFEGDRHAIRRQTVQKALLALLGAYERIDSPED
ncbi:MAG: CinA family protein [Gammaproteobacteria bacterium]